MMIGCAVICGAVNAIVTPIEAQRTDPFQFRFCFTTPISHGRSKRFLSLTQRPKDNQNGGLANGFSFPFQCCKLGEAEIHKDDFVVVNFYEFGLDINGRIYINEHGINAQYSGPSKDALGYVEWLKKDNRFSDILVQVSPALNEHAFPKLKLRYKPSLVQFEGGISHLPLLDPSMKATRLAPSEWKKRLEAANTTTSDDTSRETSNTYFILLDVRNGYEWDIGHFHGAKRPNIDCFRSTSFGLSQPEVTASDPLANVDKEKTDILMYCTGGIRCDVYSTILRQQGFQNLYTLEGGVSHYLKNEGPVKWVGNLFVFDSRLSLPPATYKPEAVNEALETEQVPKNNKFARCYICGSQVCELRHRNCANIDCNLLFLCCLDCVKDFRGCCCVNCTSAPRLRPALLGHQRYKKWHIYRDSELHGKLVA
ncbi:hypothetical protein UlMin_043945 [Ulmus minor]